MSVFLFLPNKKVKQTSIAVVYLTEVFDRNWWFHFPQLALLPFVQEFGSYSFGKRQQTGNLRQVLLH